jgi:NADH-quinone oxidoreductase subunit G
LPIGVIGEIGDLRYDYEMLGAGPETLKELADGKATSSSRCSTSGQEADDHRRAGCDLRAKRRRCRSRASPPSWRALSARHPATGTVSPCCTRLLRASAVSIIGFVPGEGGLDAARMLKETDVLFLLGADELDLRKRKEGGFTVYIAYIVYADRKIWAAVQMRRGPNVVGPWGLFQSFADMLKFVFKEVVIPMVPTRASS